MVVAARTNWYRLWLNERMTKDRRTRSTPRQVTFTTTTDKSHPSCVGVESSPPDDVDHSQLWPKLQFSQLVSFDDVWDMMLIRILCNTRFSFETSSEVVRLPPPTTTTLHPTHRRYARMSSVYPHQTVEGGFGWFRELSPLTPPIYVPVIVASGEWLSCHLLLSENTIYTPFLDQPICVEHHPVQVSDTHFDFAATGRYKSTGLEHAERWNICYEYAISM